jgi:hypothetical protein
MLRHTHSEMYLNQHEKVIILHVTDVKVTQNLFVNVLSSVCVYKFKYQHFIFFFFFFFFPWLHGPLGLALASLFRVS